jgi:hypothetical protein
VPIEAALANLLKIRHKVFAKDMVALFDEEYPSDGVEYSAHSIKFAKTYQDEPARCMSAIPCRMGPGLKYTVLLEKYLKSWHDDDRLLAVDW